MAIVWIPNTTRNGEQVLARFRKGDTTTTTRIHKKEITLPCSYNPLKKQNKKTKKTEKIGDSSFLLFKIELGRYLRPNFKY